MKSLGRLNRAQRIVLVVGLGFVLWFAAIWLGSIGSHSLFGWVAYAPLGNVTSSPLGLAFGWRILIMIGMTLVWIAASLVILGAHQTEDD
jgi:hypothetical protein